MTLGIEFVCFAMLCQGEQSKSVEASIGASGCVTELRANAEYGLALDRKQNAFAEVREIHGKPTLLVIQYGDKNDRCGVVRDIAVAPGAKDAFEFECTDTVDVKRVVIGVHPNGTYAPSWKASKAWVVDFEKLKLTPTNDPVTCLNYNYAGADDGSDVRTRAAARARKKLH